MSKIPVFLIILFFMSVVPAAGFDAEIIREMPLLRDGFVMNRVDGNLIGPDSNDVWFFELTSDVNDYRTVVKAGTRLELLPSSALEKMTADRKMRTTAAYRLLNSRVTKYKGRNFIFPGYFMPLSKAGKSEPETSQESQGKQQEPAQKPSVQERREPLALDGPNDVLAMPQEVIEKLRARRENPSTPLRVKKETRPFMPNGECRTETKHRMPGVIREAPIRFSWTGPRFWSSRMKAVLCSCRTLLDGMFRSFLYICCRAQRWS